MESKETIVDPASKEKNSNVFSESSYPSLRKYKHKWF